MKMRTSTQLALAGLTLAIVAASPAGATTKGKVALLNGSQEVPPTPSRGVGCARLELDTINNRLHYHIAYHGLTGAATGAHIHGAAGIGANAGVVHALVPGNPIVGTWNYPEAMEANIIAGNTYINLHTAAFPGGEIRGQIVDLVAKVDGFQENPPSGSSGGGYGLFTIDTFADSLRYHVTVNSIDGSETGAHIHGRALHGSNAGVVHPLPAGSPKNGVWDYPAVMEDAILNGETYVNIHSDVSPGGEIRGQITAIVAPLDSQQEVPPNNSEGCGCGYVAQGKANTELSYYLEHGSLTGPARAAHIHGFALPGNNAGVQHNIGTANPAIGLWDYAAGDAQKVIDGMTYFNVHTEAFGGGEVRGQIIIPSKPCPTDINCDGVTGFPDLLAILSAWGPYDPCPPHRAEDLNRDCAVGFADLLDVLASWGRCPQ